MRVRPVDCSMASRALLVESYLGVVPRRRGGGRVALVAKVDLTAVGQKMAIGAAVHLMAGAATVHDGNIMRVEKRSGIFGMAVGAVGAPSLLLHAKIAGAMGIVAADTTVVRLAKRVRPGHAELALHSLMAIGAENRAVAPQHLVAGGM